MNFDSILPSEIPSFDGDLILTTEKEAPRNSKIPLLFDDITEKDVIVIQGLISQKIDSGLNEDQLLLGIDPGKQIGLSVYYLCLLYTSPSPRDKRQSRMPSSA